MVFIASLPGMLCERDSVEKKPASLLVLLLSKALNGIPPYLCDRRAVWPLSPPVAVFQYDEGLRSWHKVLCKKKKTASLLEVQQKLDGVNKKLSSLIVIITLRKAFNRVLPSIRGGQVVEPSSLFVMAAHPAQRLANKA